jgi:hypothetical protein
MFARVCSWTLARLPLRRYFADVCSSSRSRWSKLSLGSKAGVVVSGLGLVGGAFSLSFPFLDADSLRAVLDADSLPFAERAAVASVLKPFSVDAITKELQVYTPPELWVEREVLEQLAPLQLETGKYVVIRGEKGTGKRFAAYKPGFPYSKQYELR